MSGTRLGRMTGGIPTSALSPDDPISNGPTKLAQAQARIARGETVTLPIFGRAFIMLLSADQRNDIDGRVFDEMPKKGLPPIALHSFSYDLHRSALTLAAAVRDPDDPTFKKPFGTSEEWLALDDNALWSCRLVYEDVKNRLDPARSMTIDDETRDAIIDAVKKNDAVHLLSLGVVTLASFLLSGGVQLASSPTPVLNTGPLSPESSEESFSNPFES